MEVVAAVTVFAIGAGDGAATVAIGAGDGAAAVGSAGDALGAKANPAVGREVSSP